MSNSTGRVLSLLIVLILTFRLTSSVGVFTDMGLPSDDLYLPGDLLLGGIFPLNRNKHGSLCGGDISPITIKGAQSMIYMIDQVNRDPKLLPNITLGYTLLNDCQTEMIALARSTQFIPVINDHSCKARQLGASSAWEEIACVGSGTEYNRTRADSNGTDGGSGGKARGVSHVPVPRVGGQYNVVGVVGPFSSVFSVVVSPLLSFYQIPHISWIATSDQLNNQGRYPYFSRVVPADSFQAKAIVDLLDHFQWTYISALYSQGTYGSLGISGVLAGAREKGICVAFTSELRSDFLNEDYDRIVGRLLKNHRAKAVVLFVEASYARRFMWAVSRAQIQGQFIYIGSEGFGANTVKGLEHLTINLLTLIIPGGPYINVRWGDDGFKRYYMSLNPWNNATGSKWYGEYIPKDVGCSWNVDKNDTDWCGRLTNVTDFPKFKFTNWHVRIMDCVKTFALALNDTIRENCPDAFSDTSILPSCINGEALQRNIRKVEFVGYSTKVKFNENGDLKGSKYMVMMHTYSEEKKYIFKGIGVWDYETRILDINDTEMVWFDMVNDTVQEVLEVPESVCAKPCHPGQSQIQGELACCWECHTCMQDQVVSADGKSCVFCEDTTWPDHSNFTTCEPIPPTFLRWTDPLAIGLVSIDLVAFLMAVSIATVFIVNREKKIVKGSSRELVALILTGLFLAGLTVLTYIMRPETWTCYLSYFGFHISCSLIFAPLFLKTFKVYQIFRAAEKCRKRVRFVSNRSMITTLLVIMAVQVIVTGSVCLLHPPIAALSTPVPHVRIVELSCQTKSHVTVLGPLSVNLVFVLLSAIFGFLTRRLPDNFNESWHIFLSVTATLVVWIAFLPTYFITFYAYHRAALLALALILNGVVTSLCLFGPKVYAVFWVEEALIKTSNFDSGSVHRSTNNPSDPLPSCKYTKDNST